jgi:putative Ca2+/H+ antiporter (TMEM165/GDT1 family)
MFSFTPFIFTFAVIALAELGDKTQMVAVTLAYKTRRMGLVAAGATLGMSLVMILNVIIGTTLSLLLPIELIGTGGAILFIGIGLVLLVQGIRQRGEMEQLEGDESAKVEKRRKSVFTSSALAVGLMEFGDKTQVAAITLAGLYNSPFSVALGAILAESLLMTAGAFIGAKLLTKTSKSAIDYLSSGLFIAAGILMLIMG